MKRLESRNAATRSQKHLVLNRETLRRLDSGDLARVAAGASAVPTCTTCGTKLPNQDPIG